MKMETKPTNTQPHTGQNHQPSLKKERAVLLMGVFSGVILLVSSILVFINTIEVVSTSLWIRTAFAAPLLLAAAANFFIGLGYLRNKPSLRLWVLLSLVCVSMVIGSLLMENAGQPAAAIVLFYSFGIGTVAGYGKQTDRAITFGVISGVAISLVDLFSPFTQIVAPQVVKALWVNVVMLAVVYLLLLLTRWVTATLRVKLLAFGLASALIPLSVASYFSIQLQLNALKVQFQENITLTANQAAATIEEFFETNKERALLDASFPIFVRYLSMPADQRAGSEVERELITTIQTLDKFREQSYVMGYGLLDTNGIVVYDTNVAKIGNSEADQQFFITPFTKKLVYTSPVRFPLYESSNIVFSSPIMDDEAGVFGVLRIQFNSAVFSTLVKPAENIYGDTAYPILLDGNLFRIADTLNPELNFEPIVPVSEQRLYELKKDHYLPVTTTGREKNLSSALANAIEESKKSQFITMDFDHIPDNKDEIGHFLRLKVGNPPYYLAYIQKQDQIFAAFEQQQNNMILAATLIAGVIGVLATLISSLISTPILQLTATAEQIAGGDINAHASVHSHDELGYLANAFNIMTERLRNLINTLEDRVKARTNELVEQNKILAFRSQQLKTISEVAKNITSTHELEELFRMVTNLISERFGFYHIGIFLLDERGEYAVLRAANSEGGKLMLQRQHKLKVGQTGLVGFAAGKGEPRIATDVGEDSVYFNNPLLPKTRSEMALPLIADQKIIGVLDVQSEKPNAFSTEDIELFETLADQIALAITNNSLLEETARALNQMQNLHRQYLQQEWQKESRKRSDIGYLFTRQGLSSYEAQDLPEILEANNRGEPVLEIRHTEEDKVENILAVPIQLRGETIGTIRLKDSGEELISWGESWGDNEVAMVREISDQIALALENARLFEQTVQRADRERKVLEITSQIRATNDPQRMLQIAAAALQKELNASRAQVILQKQDIDPAIIPSNGKSASTDINQKQQPKNGAN